MDPSSPFFSALDARDEVEEAPTLVLAEGARLHESDDVSHVALVLFVVDLVLAPPADVLAVRSVLHEALDRHHGGLLHRRAHDHAGQQLAPAALFGGRRLAHAFFSFDSAGALEAAWAFFISANTVFSRAMSRRRSRIRTGFVACRI